MENIQKIIKNVKSNAILLLILCISGFVAGWYSKPITYIQNTININVKTTDVYFMNCETEMVNTTNIFNQFGFLYFNILPKDYNILSELQLNNTILETYINHTETMYLTYGMLQPIFIDYKTINNLDLKFTLTRNVVLFGITFEGKFADDDLFAIYGTSIFGNNTLIKDNPFTFNEVGNYILKLNGLCLNITNHGTDIVWADITLNNIRYNITMSQYNS
jgi:hypothetical protein